MKKPYSKPELGIKKFSQLENVYASKDKDGWSRPNEHANWHAGCVKLTPPPPHTGSGWC